MKKYIEKLWVQLTIAFFIASMIVWIPIIYAYTCTSAATGNFSDAGTWSGCNSTYPHSGDAIVMNSNYVVTWDSSAPATIGTFTSITASGTGTGYLSLDSSQSLCSSGCTLSATTIQASSNTTGFVQIAGTTSNTFTVNAGLHSNSAGIIGGSVTSAKAIYDNTVGGALVINADMTTGSAVFCTAVNKHGTGSFQVANNSTLTSISTAYALENTSTATGTFGNYVSFIAGPSAAFANDSTGSFTIGTNAIITGGPALTSGAIMNTAAGTGSIGNNATITGGTNTSACGVYNPSGQITLGSGSALVQGTKGPAWCGNSPAWTSGSNSAQFYMGASFGQTPNTTLSQTAAGGGATSYGY